MAASLNDRDIRARMERIETLLRDVERIPDGQARACTREIVQAILDLHGAGLERMLEQIAGSTRVGVDLLESVAGDELVGSMLLLYGLHPLDMETRVRQALDKVRPSLRSHHSSVEFLGIADSVVRLRLHGGCDGCSSSADTLKQSIEQAIFDKAPEVTVVEIDGAGAEAALATNGRARVALPLLRS
jgi:Fe-S cluster biogenesis protein NfuA